ncbi:MAG: DUF3857 domain-containing protein [Calditrichaeota bacterium]|nr:DUF3857 domain-containing protein [Calditrichota bacterium]
MICFLSAVMVILSALSGNASETKKWGKVAPEFLTMTVYENDTSAAAVKLFDVGEIQLWVTDRAAFYFTRHYQIKILKESGKSYADIDIPYWHQDKILKLKAQTIQPDGKKIKVKKIYDEELKKNFKVKKFTLPAVEVGSVIEVEYKLHSKYFTELEPWVFQSDIPAIESMVTLKISTGLIFKSLMQNDPFREVMRSEVEYFNQHERKSLPMFVWHGVNLPAVKNEPYVSTLENYKKKLVFQFQGYKSRWSHVSFIKDLATLCNEMLDDDNYGSFLKPSGDVKKLVSALTQDADSEREKAKRLYEHARDQIEDESYVGSIYARKKQKKVLKERTASDSERNLFLLSMLRAAGLDAKPVLISTRDHGRVNTALPFLSQYNRTLVVTFIAGEIYLLDASDRFTPFGQVPPNSLVEVGLVIEKDNPQFLHNKNEDLKSKETIESEIAISADGRLTGKTRLTATGYACRGRNKQLEKDQNVMDFISERLGVLHDDFSVRHADSSLAATASDTFTTSFEFELSDFAETIDDELYFRPALYQCMEQNIFVSEKREFPVEFGYRSKAVELSTIELPEGYLVAEIPENKMIKNKYFQYRRMVSTFAGKLNYLRQFEITEHFVPAKDYARLKADYARVVDADQEQVVLRAKALAGKN